MELNVYHNVCDDHGTRCHYLDYSRRSSRQDRYKVFLPVPNYLQLDTFSCGFVSGLAVLHYFRPDVVPTAFAAAIRPSPVEGVGELQLMHALQQFDVRVMRHRGPNFSTFDLHLRRGRPVIVPVRGRWFGCGHWAVVYGAARPGRRLYLVNDGVGSFVAGLRTAKMMDRWNGSSDALICVAG
jgi:hypothetical protein